MRGRPFFPDRDALRDYHRHLMDEFASHCFDLFAPATSLVLKSPEISVYFAEALELMPDARFVVMTRDPRDQVASEWRIRERAVAAGDASSIERLIVRCRPFMFVAQPYVRYYEPVLAAAAEHSERVMFVRFEDLVQQPGPTVDRLAQFTGFDLSAYEATAKWPRLADSYWAYGSSHEDTPAYGEAIQPERAGAHTEVMSSREARRVARFTAAVATRLGYPTPGTS